MSLGLRRSVGNILPRLKYDARIGVFYTEDRVRDTDDVWRTEQANIDRADFRAIFDMKNVEVGWIDFPKGAPPDAKLVSGGDGAAERWGDPPSKNHKLGVRVIVKLDDTIDGAGSVRELMSTSVGLWSGLDALHDDYVAGLKEHPDMVPVVGMTNAIKTETSSGSSFEPVFHIEEFVPRPLDLPLNGIPLSAADKKKPTKTMAGMDDEIPF
jgi:hypothetical protein